MIEILKQPKTVDFTGNGLGFRIKGDDYIEQQGYIASATFDFDVMATLRNNELFRLTNFDIGISFYIAARATPDSPYEIPLVRAGLIADELNGVEEFSKFYRAYNTSIDLSTSRLHIETIIPQTYDWSNLVYFIQTLSNPQTVSGSETIFRKSYSLFGKLFTYDENNLLNGIAQFNLDPNKDKTADVFLGELLSDKLKPELPDIDIIQTNTIGVLKYRAQFAERYDVNGELLTYNAKFVDLYALKGKIDYLKFPDFDIERHINGDMRFMNNIDFPINIFKEQNYFLYTFKQSQEVGISLKLRLFYNDRTIEEFDLYTQLVYGNNPTAFYCGPGQLDIDSLANSKKWYKYQIYTDTNTNFQEFVLIDKPNFVRQFYYLNRMGVFNVFLTTGKRSSKLAIKRTNSRKYKTLDYQPEDAEVSQFIESASMQYEVGTGSITQAEADNVAYMFQSPLVFEIVNNKFAQVLIESSSVDICPEDETLFDISFNYHYAFYE